MNGGPEFTSGDAKPLQKPRRRSHREGGHRSLDASPAARSSSSSSLQQQPAGHRSRRHQSHRSGDKAVTQSLPASASATPLHSSRGGGTARSSAANNGGQRVGPGLNGATALVLTSPRSPRIRAAEFNRISNKEVLALPREELRRIWQRESENAGALSDRSAASDELEVALTRTLSLASTSRGQVVRRAWV